LLPFGAAGAEMQNGKGLHVGWLDLAGFRAAGGGTPEWKELIKTEGADGFMGNVLC